MTTLTTTAADRTLFHVATAQLADPLAWWQIAQTSGVADPWLPTLLTVVMIPPLAADNGGGLPPSLLTGWPGGLSISTALALAAMVSTPVPTAAVPIGGTADFLASDFSSEFLS